MKRQLITRRGMMIFILLLAITGFVLNLTHHFALPWNAIEEINAINDLLDHAPEVVNTTPAETTNSGDTVFMSASGGISSAAITESADISDSTSDSINLSQIGDVLFNLWFLCAMTALLIAAQSMIGFSVRQMKRGYALISR